MDRLERFQQAQSGCLLLRHSLRYEPENATPGFDVPLTEEGVALAEAAGVVLKDLPFGALVSASPRCVNTAEAMLRGAGQSVQTEILSLLKEPGCFARPEQGVGRQFRDLGPLGFVNGVLKGTVTGAEPAEPRTGLLLETLTAAGATLAVTHDTILATVMGVLMQRPLQQEDWPLMLEGVLLQRRGNAVDWFWRQQQGCWELPV